MVLSLKLATSSRWQHVVQSIYKPSLNIASFIVWSQGTPPTSEVSDDEKWDDNGVSVSFQTCTSFSRSDGTLNAYYYLMSCAQIFI